MKVGGRRELIIPPSLAYGKAGSPPTIPPNSPLVFVVDLLSILLRAVLARSASRPPARRGTAATRARPDMPLSLCCPRTTSRTRSRAASRTSFGAQDAPGTGDAGDPAGQVDRVPVVVAGALQRRARWRRRPAGSAGRRPGRPRAVTAPHRHQRRRDLGADEHRGVADRLDETHRRLRHVGERARRAARERPPSSWALDLGAEAREPDHVDEAHA